jgi:hypothetical protein
VRKQEVRSEKAREEVRSEKARIEVKSRWEREGGGSMKAVLKTLVSHY